MSDAQDLTQAEFDAKVLEGSKAKPVVVDFWAEWCGPCKAMEPMWNEVVAEYKDRVDFYKVNVDVEGPLSMRYGVMSIPTTIYFQDGKPAGQTIGLVDKSELVGHIEKLLK
ncbi:thioredoxin [Candidatus Berkelbacteria bacterium]|nr:thioredoxin [Candidatus Berkelbacteria bacterium]